MKLKLDENMPRRVAHLLAEHGHEAATVVEQGLGGKSDATVARAAAQEGRMVVTLDRRFADIAATRRAGIPGFWSCGRTIRARRQWSGCWCRCWPDTNLRASRDASWCLSRAQSASAARDELVQPWPW
ncbi:MAG: DUF5615 family PIN-like protein [Chloroflexi bacterium]|nr:DUF5615 family PIN-like protein [Chloroflexota bacterium]